MNSVAQFSKDNHNVIPKEEDLPPEEEIEEEVRRLSIGVINITDILGHRSFECPKNECRGQLGFHITQVEEGEVNEPKTENSPKTRESLLLKKVLLNPMKDINEPTQRKDLLRNFCKVKGKCCNVVINSRSTNNLVFT